MPEPITFFEAMAAMRAGSTMLRRVNDRNGGHWAKMRIVAAAVLQQQRRWSGTWFTCNQKFNALLTAQWARLETER